ncbi:hypothetical protein [Achromobacter arsenitoxydans]|uniref:Uncharacterized protein n=1 Tax=Achromobacter arsenitoxydans SY8 TaxID=477184 RepID=H0FAE1_9BURK|nr:hypothetical protein [Achromobacter arsenitoxydans]EHK64772.1 hypothetical protein KYC_18215 [Achromobacter arsenitoxydans SY8]
MFATEPTDLNPNPMTSEQVAAVMAVYGAHDPDAAPPPDVPQVVSRFQGREAMHRTAHGDGTLFEAAEALLAQPDTPAWYRRAWDDLQEFRRDSEMLAAIAGMLGLSAAKIDALFILAGSIKA